MTYGCLHPGRRCIDPRQGMHRSRRRSHRQILDHYPCWWSSFCSENVGEVQWSWTEPSSLSSLLFILDHYPCYDSYSIIAMLHIIGACIPYCEFSTKLKWKSIDLSSTTRDELVTHSHTPTSHPIVAYQVSQHTFILPSHTWIYIHICSTHFPFRSRHSHTHMPFITCRQTFIDKRAPPPSSTLRVFSGWSCLG